QLQKRRLSTAHGSSDGVGASGSSSATTSSSSPVSRSTYSRSGSASMITSRPVEGVRMRYFWRVLIQNHATSGPPGRAPSGARRPGTGFYRVPPVKGLASIPRGLLALAPGALVLVALAGCDVKHPTANQVTGKKLFVSKCGSCHTLSHASTQGTVGPNLDDAFRQDKADGVKSTSIQGLISYWIKYPNTQGAMPANCAKNSPFCLSSQNTQDVAAYVARVAAVPGQDSGALASAVQTVSQKPAVEKNGVLQIDADPNGLLKFLASSASAKSGSVTIQMKNASSVPHDIAIKGAGLNQVGAVVSGGGTSKVTANLKPGTYTFYCSVDGHEAAGMKGTLTVK